MMLLPAQEKIVVELVRQAGAKLLQYWPGSKDCKELGVKKKADGTLVTKADVAANEILVNGLRAAFPDDAIFSEELPPDARVHSGVPTWIIDPLDGTQPFVEGESCFAVLVARSEKGIITFACMYFPAEDNLILAQKGKGATSNGMPLSVSTSSKIAPNRLFLRRTKLEDPRVRSTWLDQRLAFLSLARGDLDAIICSRYQEEEWDLAAPALIIEEAGGHVTTDKDEAVLFKYGPLQYRYFVATNKAVHAEALSVIKDLKDEFTG